MNLEEETKKFKQKEIQKFKEKYHPFFLYKKLKGMDIGMNEEEALRVANHYEKVFYEPLCKLVDFYKKNYDITMKGGIRQDDKK